MHHEVQDPLQTHGTPGSALSHPRGCKECKTVLALRKRQEWEIPDENDVNRTVLVAQVTHDTLEAYQSWA